MPRLRSRLDLRLDAAALSHLVDNGRAGRSGEFVVRVRGDHLRAHRNSRSYDSLPQFRGRTQATADGLAVHGEIKEAFGAAIWTRGFAFATALMLGILALGVVQVVGGDRVGLAPLFIGAIGCVAFAVLWIYFRRRRRPAFDEQSRELTEALRLYLTTGDSEPSYD